MFRRSGLAVYNDPNGKQWIMGIVSSEIRRGANEWLPHRYYSGALCGLARDAEDSKFLYDGRTAAASDVRSGNLRTFDINDFDLRSMTYMLDDIRNIIAANTSPNATL